VRSPFSATPGRRSWEDAPVTTLRIGHVRRRNSMRPSRVAAVLERFDRLVLAVNYISRNGGRVGSPLPVLIGGLAARLESVIRV